MKPTLQSVSVTEMLISTGLLSGYRIELSGWLVETDEGLYVLGDHYPEDYFYPSRVRITNDNIVYPILEKVPSLGGGWSLLFHRSKIRGVVGSDLPRAIMAEGLLIEETRGAGAFINIDISPENVERYVRVHGDFKFHRARNPLRDWLED